MRAFFGLGPAQGPDSKEPAGEKEASRLFAEAEQALNQLRVRTAGATQDDNFALLNRAQRAVVQLDGLVRGGSMSGELAAVWRRCALCCSCLCWQVTLHSRHDTYLSLDPMQPS
jgi:hypothetical protein